MIFWTLCTDWCSHVTCPQHAVSTLWSHIQLPDSKLNNSRDFFPDLAQIFRRDACKPAEHCCKFLLQRHLVWKTSVFYSTTYCVLLHRIKFCSLHVRSKNKQLGEFLPDWPQFFKANAFEYEDDLCKFLLQKWVQKSHCVNCFGRSIIAYVPQVKFDMKLSNSNSYSKLKNNWLLAWIYSCASI